MSKSKTINVISGTHWDREWRYTADQSLLRLVELIDDLLNILEKNEDYKCFHLDGGTVIIEDYLSIRPENADRLANLIKSGRIQTVMWYTLPEMSSVSPEALIRNLLIGRRLGNKFGGVMKTGYTATSYGQISQLPQIYAGFAMKTAMSYRGTNKHQVPPLCLWESPDGTRIYHIRAFDEVTRTNWFFFPHYRLVLGKNARDLSTKWNEDDWPVHMADEKLYETAFQLKNGKFDFNTDKQEIISAISHLVKQASPQAIGDNILALDLEDNAAPYSNLPDMIKAMNAAQQDYHIKQSSLDEFVESALGDVKDSDLKIIKGEMRFTAIEAGFNGLNGATHSSRLPLKLMNDEAQLELINVAEPLCAISSMLGGNYEISLLNRAWLKLLKNHAHDSICGAAIDLAHKDNPARFRAVTAIAGECSRKACEDIWIKLDTKSAFKPGDITLTFFNTLPIERKAIESVIIDIPKPNYGDSMTENWTGLGPIIEDFDPDKLISYFYFDIVDENGNEIPYELLEKENIEIEVEQKLDSSAAAYSIQRNRVLLDVTIPALGYRTYALRPRTRKYIFAPKPGADRKLIAASDGILENEYLKIKINPNGTFDITDKDTGKNIQGMHYFHDNGSIGGSHVNETPLRDYTVTSLGSCADITLSENNSLRATWKVNLQMTIPASANLDGRNRSEKMTALPISTFLTLSRGSRRLEIKTSVSNAARDHRLRLMLPTDIKTDYVYADAPFDVIKRQIQWNDTAENAEAHYPFNPMLNFAGLSDDNSGISFLSKGLNEYEVLDDHRRTLAVTLIRTTRQYMAANKGLFTPQEYARHTGQHCLGDIDFEYAVYMHQGKFVAGKAILQAQDFKVPQRIIQGVPKPGTLPASSSFITISPNEHIHISALYKTENADGYILRLWNSHHEPVQAEIETSIEFKSISKISMDQQRQEGQLIKKANRWLLPLRKAEISTLYIKC